MPSSCRSQTQYFFTRYSVTPKKVLLAHRNIDMCQGKQYVVLIKLSRYIDMYRSHTQQSNKSFCCEDVNITPKNRIKRYQRFRFQTPY